MICFWMWFETENRSKKGRKAESPTSDFTFSNFSKSSRTSEELMVLWKTLKKRKYIKVQLKFSQKSSEIWIPCKHLLA